MAEPEEAIKDLSTAIELNGDVSRDYVLRGDLHYSLQRYSLAVRDYQKAVEIEQHYLDPVKRYVGLLTTCPDPSYHDPELAIELAHSAARRSSWQSADALILLAAAHAAAGDFDEALRWQEQAIAIAPEEARQELRKSANEFEQAKKDAQASQPAEDAPKVNTQQPSPTPPAASPANSKEPSEKQTTRSKTPMGT